MSKAAYLKTRARALRSIINDPATSPADREWAENVLQGYAQEIDRRATLHAKRKARAERVARAKAQAEAKAARKAAGLAKAAERAAQPRRLRGRPRTKATRVQRDADGNWRASWPLPYGQEYVSTHFPGLTRRQVRSSRPEVVVRAWRDPKFIIPTASPENEAPQPDLAPSGAPLPRRLQCLLNSQHHVNLERFKSECQRLVVACIEEGRLDVARRVLRALEREVHPKPSGGKADPSATTKPTSPVAAVTLPVTPTPTPNPPPSNPDPLTEVEWFASNQHPHYENSPTNVSHLNRWVTVRNLPFTSANMAKAFSELTAAGALTPRATPLAAPTVAPSVQPEVPQHPQARPQKPNLDVAREDELHRAQVLAGTRTATVSELKRWSEDRHQSLNNILRLERMLRSAEQAER